MNSFYSHSDLSKIGLKSFGKNVNLSQKASFYNPSKTVIGNNVRIDDFCIVSGNVTIGNNIHISAGTYLFGGEAGIVIDDYAAVASRCCIYAESDDFYGLAIGNSNVPRKFRRVSGGTVTIEKYVSIGAGCIILPSVTVSEGAAIAAMSFVNKSLKSWWIYSGSPCKKLCNRSKDLLKLVDMHIEESLDC